MMIDIGTSPLFAMEIEGNEFTLVMNRVTDGGWLPMSREELQDLRSICDQALNTSAEELGGWGMNEGWGGD
jgi:hypothetical protein